MPYKVLVNERTYMAMETDGPKCLGAVGANFYRSWVFPLYTPSGHTVVREFAFDHPFHNGCFVGQHPVLLEGRRANFWAMPPRRGPADAIFEDLGRMDFKKEPDRTEIHAQGVGITQEAVWRDQNEEPVLNEVRTSNFIAAQDATLCDLTSHKRAAYGALEFPQTKFGSIGMRVEPRLLPPLGGTVIGDGGRRGSAEEVHEQESDFVAFENVLPNGQRFGVLMGILGEARGPWFIRDYGMALYNPTWRQSIHVPQGESWTIGLRFVAYEGALTEHRAQAWLDL